MFKIIITLTVLSSISFTALAGTFRSDIQKNLVCKRALLLAQKSAPYKTLFEKKSPMGTCGPTCLINISFAVEAMTHRPSIGFIEKMKLIKQIMHNMSTPLEADKGTSRENIGLIAEDFFNALHLGPIEIRDYQDNGWQKKRVNDILLSIAKNEIALISVNNHWVILTGYDKKTKKVSFLDPNFPNLELSKSFFYLNEDKGEKPRFTTVKGDIFEKLYGKIRSDVFEDEYEEYYLSLVVILKFPNL